MKPPRLLDLFCKAGGASMGYHRAGFEVVGVDIHPQPRYPFEFHQADALTFPLDGFDAIHASPPCQSFSALRSLWPERSHQNLIPDIRARLRGVRVPSVIENVPRSPLLDPVMLCGSMFGLGLPDGQLRRHRLFETNWPLYSPGPCSHAGRAWGVYGHGSTDNGHGRTLAVNGARRIMGIDWMTRDELAQAIPPAYTEWIGRHLLTAI